MLVNTCEIPMMPVEVASVPLWKFLDFCGISTDAFWVFHNPCGNPISTFGNSSTYMEFPLICSGCPIMLVGVPLVPLWESHDSYGIPINTLWKCHVKHLQNVEMTLNK